MSKKDDIIKYINEHPGCTTFECRDMVGCSIGYVRQIFSENGYKAPKTFPTRRKYIEGTIIGDNNVFFKKRLDNNNGLFICPFDGKEFVGSISGVGLGLIKSCGCLHSSTSREQTFIDLTGQRFGKLTVEYCLPYTTKENRAIWHCKCDCGGYKDAVGKLLRNGHIHSCGCSNSKGEVLLRNILQSLKESFEEQKIFNNFVNSRGVHYKFDFYLPEYNTCLEYDGKQHYVGWAYKEDSLRKIQQNDTIKTQYCRNHGITLVRFPYFCYDNITQETVREVIEGLKNGRISTLYTFGTS